MGWGAAPLSSFPHPLQFSPCWPPRWRLWLRALVGNPDGTVILRAEARGPSDAPEALGVAVAEDLLSQGAGEILAAVYGDARG